MSSAPQLLVAPLEALADPRLTDPERRVLLALFSFRGRDTQTVWPSLPAISARANMSDQTRISKLTSSLASKGWLTKKKRGFTGGNSYSLTVPECAIEHLANLDSGAKLARESKLRPDALSNLDSDTKSNLDSDAKCKEQTIEHTNEQTIETSAEPKTVRSLNVLHLQEALPSLSTQVASDYLAFRKQIKAPLNLSSWLRIAGEVEVSATFLSLSPDQILSEAMSAGWRGFKHAWLVRRLSENQGASHGAHQRPAPVTIDHNDTSWADGFDPNNY